MITIISIYLRSSLAIRIQVRQSDIKVCCLFTSFTGGSTSVI